jgi:hypothetical protein
MPEERENQASSMSSLLPTPSPTRRRGKWAGLSGRAERSYVQCCQDGVVAGSHSGTFGHPQGAPRAIGAGNQGDIDACTNGFLAWHRRLKALRLRGRPSKETSATCCWTSKTSKRKGKAANGAHSRLKLGHAYFFLFTGTAEMSRATRARTPCTRACASSTKAPKRFLNLSHVLLECRSVPHKTCPHCRSLSLFVHFRS